MPHLYIIPSAQILKSRKIFKWKTHGFPEEISHKEKCSAATEPRRHIKFRTLLRGRLASEIPIFSILYTCPDPELKRLCSGLVLSCDEKRIVKYSSSARDSRKMFIIRITLGDIEEFSTGRKSSCIGRIKNKRDHFALNIYFYNLCLAGEIFRSFPANREKCLRRGCAYIIYDMYEAQYCESGLCEKKTWKKTSITILQRHCVVLILNILKKSEFDMNNRVSDYKACIFTYCV